MTRSYLESDLHKTVAKYLDLVLRKPTWWTSIAHGETCDFKRGARMKARGAKKGVPDLVIIHEGKAHWIELKSPDGKLSKDQIDCHFKLAEAGASVATCRSLSQVEAVLALWRIPSRATPMQMREAA